MCGFQPPACVQRSPTARNSSTQRSSIARNSGAANRSKQRLPKSGFQPLETRSMWRFPTARLRTAVPNRAKQLDTAIVNRSEQRCCQPLETTPSKKRFPTARNSKHVAVSNRPRSRIHSGPQPRETARNSDRQSLASGFANRSKQRLPLFP